MIERERKDLEQRFVTDARALENKRREEELEPQIHTLSEIMNTSVEGTTIDPQTFIPLGSKRIVAFAKERGLGTYENVIDAIDQLGPKVFGITSNIEYDPNYELAVQPHAIDTVYIAGVAAAVSLPDHGYDGERIPKPSKRKENDTQKTFRLAANKLIEIEGVQKNRGKGKNLVADKVVELLKKQQNPDDREIVEAADSRIKKINLEITKNAFSEDAAKFAGQYRRQLSESNLTAEESRTELLDIFRHEKEHEEALNDWVPLVREETGRTVNTSDTSSGIAKTPIDAESRKEALLELIDNWGEGGIKESTFSGRDGSKYYAAVLPETNTDGRPVTLPDGTPIEHAVLESPDGARYAYRGEKGYRPGIPTETFVDVFNRRTKTEAKEHGAKKIVHKGEWQERTLEYLTRDSKDLDK